MSSVFPISLGGRGIKRSLKPLTNQAVPGRGYRQKPDPLCNLSYAQTEGARQSSTGRRSRHFNISSQYRVLLRKNVNPRRNMSSTTDYQELEALARKGRWLAIRRVAGSGAGHW